MLESLSMTVDLWQILLLAVVQGIGEFLPISSSGHVVILADLLSGGNPESMDVGEVNIVLHVGTLLSILVFYARRISDLLLRERRLLGPIVVGTLPAVCVGLIVKRFAPGILESTSLAGAMLVVTGLMLIWASRQGRGAADYRSLGYKQALLIGISQAAAILPGLSRSGATISAGLRLKLAPPDAATFSFLLAIPIIAGGGAYEVLAMARDQGPGGTPPMYLFAGGTVSFVVGLASLWWLMKWLEQGRFRNFAWWCIPLGLGVLLWQRFV